MDEERPNIGYDAEDQIPDDAGSADDPVLSEGVGGMPDIEPDERATVSDVDGDNVEEDD